MKATDRFELVAASPDAPVVNRAVAAALRRYRFTRPVAVTVEGGMQILPGAMRVSDVDGHIWVADYASAHPDQHFMGHATYVPPVEDVEGSAPPLFHLSWIYAVTADEVPEVPEVPPVTGPLILQGEMLEASFLDVRVPVQVTIRIDRYCARYCARPSMGRVGEWCVRVRSIPIVTRGGRVTARAWVTAALDALVTWASTALSRVEGGPCDG